MKHSIIILTGSNSGKIDKNIFQGTYGNELAQARIKKAFHLGEYIIKAGFLNFNMPTDPLRFLLK